MQKDEYEKIMETKITYDGHINNYSDKKLSSSS